MDVVEIVFHSIGFVVTLLNVLTFLALRRRLIRAFPKRALLVTLLVAVPFWLLLHPGIFLMFGGVSGLMSVRDDTPQWIGIAAMAFQFGVWVYGAFILVKYAPLAMIAGVRRLRRLARAEQAGTEPEREIVDEQRRALMAKAALAVPAAIIATAAGGAMASRAAPRIHRL